MINGVFPDKYIWMILVGFTVIWNINATINYFLTCFGGGKCSHQPLFHFTWWMSSGVSLAFLMRYLILMLELDEML